MDIPVINLTIIWKKNKPYTYTNTAFQRKQHLQLSINDCLKQKKSCVFARRVGRGWSLSGRSLLHELMTTTAEMSSSSEWARWKNVPWDSVLFQARYLHEWSLVIFSMQKLLKSEFKFGFNDKSSAFEQANFMVPHYQFESVPASKSVFQVIHWWFCHQFVGECFNLNFV